MSYGMGDMSMGGAPVGGPASGYPSTNDSGAGQQRYPQLNGLLRTQDGFKRSIAYSGAANAAIGVVLAIAIFALIRNIFATIQAMTEDGDAFFPLFFSVRSETSDHDPFLVFIVYAPLVLIPVLIILFIVKKVTYDASVTKVWDAYMRGGFVSDLARTGIPCRIGNQRGWVCVLGAPNVPPDWVQSAAQRLAASASNDPKSRETKSYVASVAKAATAGGLNQAAQLANIDSGYPQGIFVTGVIGANDTMPRIAIAKDGDFTKLRLYGLRKDAPRA